MLSLNKSYYKWYIMILASAIHGIIGIQRLCLPPLFPEIVSSLRFDMTQLMTVWGIEPLAGVLVSLIGGLLIDRFGIKRILAVTCFLSGVAAALRGFSWNFLSMATAMFIFGLLTAMMPTQLQKALAIWFVGNRLALANGMMMLVTRIGMVFGSITSVTVFAPLLGGWRPVLILFGIPGILLGPLWFLTVREPDLSTIRDDNTDAVSNVPFREAFSHVVRIKEIWIIGVISMGAFALYNSLIGYLPIYLTGIGWDNSTASSALSLLIGISATSILPLSVFSDKIGSRKIVLFPSLLITAVSAGIMPFVGGYALWALIIVIGIMVGPTIPLTTCLAVEQKGVGARYAGTAAGVINSLSMLGGCLGPPVGGAIADIYGGGAALITWAIVSLVTLIGFLEV